MIPEKIFKELDSPKQLPFDGQFVAKCPCHDDEHPSLYIKKDKETGKIVFHCMAGCKTEDIVKAMRLEMKDLFVNGNDRRSKDSEQKQYFYHDKTNQEFGLPKSFLQKPQLF